MTIPPTSRSRIAVVGVSALFPGSLDATGFWRDILRGKDLITDVPPTHWLLEDYYDPDPSVPDKTYARRGGFLEDVPFDAMGWGVPPNIVPETDTSQLLALIVAQQVLDDACQSGNQLDRSRTSVILGVTSGQELLGSMVSRLQRPVWIKALRESGIPEEEAIQICERISSHYTPWKESTFPGLLGNVVAGRIANRLDLGGTNCVSDAACASTFSALSMGVRELQLGDSDAVITGGVDTMNDIFMFMCFSKTPALSASGDCRPFSDQADGTMLGEGLGMVVLKRLEDAERDGDRIYAVINGVGSSSDGRSKSVYAPVSKGQARSLERAYEQAGYGPETVELIEAHGTGTIAGDAAEFDGLRMAFEKAPREDRQWCALGSVKSQIGHTKSAAGAAGLFKAVMALHHKVLPPTIKVERPNPALELESSPFHLATRSRPWIRSTDQPRRASVSSFGFGGSNFHVALSEYQRNGSGKAESAPRLRSLEAELVLLSALDPGGILEQLRAHAGRAERRGYLAWLARTSQRNFEARAACRLAIVTGEDELAEKLGEAIRHIENAPDKDFVAPNGLHYAAEAHPDLGKTAFLFSGQGSQYLDMGGALAMHFERARKPWDTAAGLDWQGTTRLHQVVYPQSAFDDGEQTAQEERLSATEWAQPAIGCTSLSMLGLLQDLGLEADCYGGHSFGEVTAMCAAGVLSQEDFLSVARRRGELMRDAARIPGAMTAVSEELERVRALIEDEAAEVVIANHNHPHQVVLSGPTGAIETIEQRLAREGIPAKRLNVATAFHSPVVADASGAFAEYLESVDFAPPRNPVYSNRSATVHDGSPEALRRELALQLAAPVRFVEMIEGMYEAGVRSFVEVGPGAIQSGLVNRILGHKPHRAVQLNRKGRCGLAGFLAGVASLSVTGYELDYDALWQGYREPDNPHDRSEPKLTLAINGANYGKPYPPPGGAAELPAPNPPRAQSRAPESRAPETGTPETGVPETGVSAGADASTSARPAGRAPAELAVSATASAATPPNVATPIEPSPDLPSDATPYAPGWPEAIQETQRQTAEAHSHYLQMMAQSHTAFLETMERGLKAGLGLPSAAVTQTPMTQLPDLRPVPLAPAESHLESGSESRSQSPAESTFQHPVAAPPPSVSPAVAAPVPERRSVESRPAPAPVAPRIDLHALMLQVVSEKTGYPSDMLEPGMELEGDLGIDSIKRVEILSEMTLRAPGLPELDTSELAELQTLKQVVDYLDARLAQAPVSQAPAPVETIEAVEAVAAPTTEKIDLHALMLQVVSEKTGYPADMLQTDMELEGDLGIDSIKRVEILSEMTVRAPGLPELDTSELAELQTLGQVVDYLDARLNRAAPSPGAIATAQPAVAQVDLHALMLQVVSEKTGYPADMLQSDMELEGDLGIDSIKRVEILSEMTVRAPGLPELDTSELAELQTLGQVVDYLEQRLTGGALRAAPSEPSDDPWTATPSTEERGAPAADVDGDVELEVGRFPLETVERPPIGMAMSGLFGDGPILVTPNGAETQKSLVAALRARGIDAVAADQTLVDTLVADRAPAGLRGVVFLGGLRSVDDAEQAIAINHEAFELTRSVAPVLEKAPTGVFVTVQDTGGAFGFGNEIPGECAWLAGCAALARTAALEWPTIGVKAIDLERAGRSADELADAIVQELTAGGPELNVGLTSDGRRLGLHNPQVELEPGIPVLEDGDVVVASGGARGVTAATLIELASVASLRFVLLGRTKLTEENGDTREIAEPDFLRSCETDAELKGALLARAREQGEKPTPAELGREVSNILARREIRATLEAIEARGSQARYAAVDVTDTSEVEVLLASVRQDWGAIKAIVHGAGVLADKLLSEKTTEQFDRVFDTKVEGLKALLSATASDPLSVICLFSSVAARTGNLGQSDYAMANEVLNKVALSEARRRGGRCLVKSLGWGPWKGGMVSPQLEAHFAAMGVPLIALDVGARMLTEELTDTARDTVEIVLGGDPHGNTMTADERPFRMEVLVSEASHPYLADHSIDGTPVLPMVMAVEWFARAARAAAPDRFLASLEDFEVVRGIPLPRFSSRPERFVVEARHPAGPGGDRILELSLSSSATEKAEGALHYRARGVLTTQCPTPEAASDPSSLALEPWADRPIYDNPALFHGPELQVIETVAGVSQAGIRVTLRGVSETEWKDAYWCTDPAALDGGLQAAVLWCDHAMGGPSLPTRINQIRFFTDRPSTGSIDCRVAGRESESFRGVSDVEFIDSEGRLLVQFLGLHTHLRSRQLATS